MRLLFYETKTSSFFLGLKIPSSSSQLSHLQEAGPELYRCLLESDDGQGTRFRATVTELRRMAQEYLEENVDQKNSRNPKSIQLHRPGKMALGPGKGLTGFKIDGLNSSARIEEDRIRITSYCKKTDSDTVTTVYCDVFPVDEGELRIDYTRGTGSYAFVAKLHESLSGVKRKTVWIQVEY